MKTFTLENGKIYLNPVTVKINGFVVKTKERVLIESKEVKRMVEYMQERRVKDESN